MFRDNMVGDVAVRDKPNTLFLFVALTPWDRQLAQVTSPSHIVDTKSLYHVVRKGSAGSRQVRRSAVEMAIVADSLRQMGTASSDARRRTHQCRVGHDQRCAGVRDIKTGRLTPQQKQAKMKQRSEQPHLKLSPRSAAEQTRNESSQREKDAADDSLEDSADAMVAVERARKTGSLTPEERRMARGSRDRWRHAIEQGGGQFFQDETGSMRSWDHRSTSRRRRSDSTLLNQREKEPAVNFQSGVLSSFS